MNRLACFVGGVLAASAPLAAAYPIFGSEETGMRRLAYERLV